MAQRGPTWGAAIGAAVLLAACGGSSGSGGGGGGGGDDDQSALPDKVTIAALLPLTGQAAFVGEEMQQGLDLWAEEHNASSEGLPKVEIAYADSQASAAVAVQAYQQLRSKGDIPMIVSTYTNVGSSIATFATRDEVAVWHAAQGTAGADLGPTFSQILPAYVLQIQPLAEAAVNAGAKRIATVAVKDNEAFIAEADRLAEDICPELGCEVVSQTLMSSDGSDAAAAAIQAQSSNPDAIMVNGVVTQFTPFTTKLKTDGYEGFVFGFTDLAEMVNAKRTDLIEGAIYTRYNVDDSREDYRTFTAAFDEAFGGQPPGYTTQGYKVGQIISAVLAHLDENGLEWTGPNILEAQLAVKAETIAGPVEFGEDRRIKEEVQVWRVESGKPVEIGSGGN